MGLERPLVRTRSAAGSGLLGGLLGRAAGAVSPALRRTGDAAADATEVRPPAAAGSSEPWRTPDAVPLTAMTRARAWPILPCQSFTELWIQFLLREAQGASEAATAPAVADHAVATSTLPNGV